LNSAYTLILDVRTSAHLRYSGPLWGQVPMPTRLRIGHASEVICLITCFWFHQKPKAAQTVKLTLDHRDCLCANTLRRLEHQTLPARYTDVDPSNRPNRPHISSENQIVKEHERQNQTDCANPY